MQFMGKRTYAAWFRIWIGAVVSGFAAVSFPSLSIAEDYQTVWIDVGQNVDVYWEINLSGTVYLAADKDGASACLDYWWITWPFGRVEQLGRHCGRARFDLPGLGQLAIGGKLRAGGAEARTRLRGTSNEQVANQFPGIRF